MDVRQIITTSLANRGLGSYQSHAEPIITEIESVLSDAVDNLTQFAVEKGLTREEAHEAFVDAGLVQPVVHEASTSDGEVGKIAATVESLAAFARRHGWRG